MCIIGHAIRASGFIVQISHTVVIDIDGNAKERGAECLVFILVCTAHGVLHEGVLL